MSSNNKRVIFGLRLGVVKSSISHPRLPRFFYGLLSVAICVLMYTGWCVRQQAGAAGTAIGPIVFENVIETSGVRFVMDNNVSPRKHQIETMLAGVAVFDYNNDGLMDLYFVNGARLPGMDKSD